MICISYVYVYSIYHTIYMCRNRCAFLKSRLSQVILTWEYLGTKPENQLSGEAVQHLNDPMFVAAFDAK